MSRYRSKGWIVAINHSFSGPVGELISDFQDRTRCRILRQIEKHRELGEIPDEEIVLEEYAELKSLDPKHWKDQDHYAVIGLPKLRHRATQDQIKFAYRKAVLKHHPDKRRRRGETLGNECDDYFSCITRANEVLGTQDSRRSYDSIDPYFDDDIPSKTSKEDFFRIFPEVFERNARWSVTPGVPLLGDEWSLMDEVDRFYNFWYNFNSWREYSYLDEENKEKAEDAYERRWMEKQNRAARATRKKEENQRIRQLVDNAYASDPRIHRYKEEEKMQKEREKAAKVESARKAREEKLAIEREKQLKIEEEERKVKEEKKRKAAAAKKEKDKENKLLKEERSKLQEFCKSKNYFRDNESDRIKIMDELNHLCVVLDLTSLQQLNNNIDSSEENQQKFVEDELEKLKKKVEEEKQKHLESSSKSRNGPTSNGSSKSTKWSYEDLQILIKAVNLFPAGTADRWEVVANYINAHSNTKSRTGKECLARAKNLKESELKSQANQKAFAKFQEKHLADARKAAPSNNDISKRFDGPQPWTGDEQKRLEQALKTFPSSTPQRWDKIADSMSGRTKKECMLRYKELVEMVKAKKAINQQTRKA